MSSQKRIIREEDDHRYALGGAERATMGEAQPRINRYGTRETQKSKASGRGRVGGEAGASVSVGARDEPAQGGKDKDRTRWRYGE